MTHSNTKIHAKFYKNGSFCNVYSPETNTTHSLVAIQTVNKFEIFELILEGDVTLDETKKERMARSIEKVFSMPCSKSKKEEKIAEFDYAAECQLAYAEYNLRSSIDRF